MSLCFDVPVIMAKYPVLMQLRQLRFIANSLVQ